MAAKKKTAKKKEEPVVEQVEQQNLGTLNEVKEEKAQDLSLKQEYVDLRPADVYINEEDVKVMGDRLQQVADDYKEELDRLTDVEELKEIEQKWIAQLEQFDKYINAVRYTLPNNVVFNGKIISKQNIGAKIIYFLNKIEVEWKMCLGMWQLCRFWATAAEEITYGAYDSTLNSLGAVKFRGMKEWEDILSINDYFTQCNYEYARDLTALQYLSTMHNHVINRIQILSPVKTEIVNE